MVKTFKPVISADFLKMIEDSRVGKALIEATGFSAYKMLTRFSLNLPTLSTPTGWSIDCYDVKLAYNQPDVILFLKYAWLYSETETNEHIDNLLHAVALDITSFEKDLLLEEGEKKASTSALILRKQEEIIVESKEKVKIHEEELLQSSLLLQKHEETIVKSKEEIKIQREKLIKSRSEIEAQKIQMNQQEQNIKVLSCELDVKLKKEKKISLRNSKSASGPRGCIEMGRLLEELVRNNPKKRSKELWALIPWERDGGEFYKENGKLHHNIDCGCREFGIKAFYARIQKIKGKSKKIPASDAK